MHVTAKQISGRQKCANSSRDYMHAEQQYQSDYQRLKFARLAIIKGTVLSDTKIVGIVVIMHAGCPHMANSSETACDIGHHESTPM
jgi:hypothetical protein